MSFGITPVSNWPPPASDDFPQYLQFQANGVDMGGADADTLDFRGAVSATRGEGENANRVTVTFGATTWVEKTADHTLEATDKEGAIAMNAATSVTVTVPDDDTLEIDENLAGISVLIYQEGAGQVSVVPVSGVTLRTRDTLLAATAGQYAVATLIRRGPNEWVLCGDLETT